MILLVVTSILGGGEHPVQPEGCCDCGSAQCPGEDVGEQGGHPAGLWWVGGCGFLDWVISGGQKRRALL